MACLADMSRRRSRARGRLFPLVAWAGASLALVAGGLAACANAVTSGDTTAEAGSDASSRSDGSPAGEDGGATGTDAADGGVPAILDGPGEAGAECALNRDCNAALRCECSDTAGCACKAGVRGTGQNGVSPCVDGNACASSVCVEGPPDSGSFCSDECKTSADCTGKLPLCSDIAFVGRICIRQPPM
jgi:hypothetical protein